MRSLRQRAMNTLKRMRPRAYGQMAAKLAQHWEKAFQSKGTDCTIDLQPWTEQMPTLRDFQDWEVTVEDVAQAVRRAGSTAPGPDSIPFSFWKGLGELGHTAV